MMLMTTSTVSEQTAMIDQCQGWGWTRLSTDMATISYHASSQSTLALPREKVQV